MGRGNIPLAKDLIKRGANVNIKNLEGNTPLLFALGRGYRELALLLIESGADIDVKDRVRTCCCACFHDSCSTYYAVHAAVQRENSPLLFYAAYTTQYIYLTYALALSNGCVQSSGVKALKFYFLFFIILFYFILLYELFRLLLFETRTRQ